VTSPDRVSPQWAEWRRNVSVDEYESRFSGPDAHGEADFVASFAPRTVLDAGCGTGRIAIELDRRGFEVVGVDLDEDLLMRAGRKSSDVRWALADLATMELARRFDVVLLAGNVMLYCRVEDRPDVVANCAHHLAPHGRLIAGFSLELPGIAPLTLAEYDEMCASSRLELAERWATWDRQPYAGGPYAVSVHRRIQT
jgi:2-polyprenyl-3-methyl-5-hydroxy-6-metoxy-1,4-benzoquinol methylase